METEERPAKIRKIREPVNLETSIEHSMGNVQGLETQVENTREVSSNSRLDSSLEHEERKATVDPQEATMSKNAMKKLRKQQQWEAGRDFRKIKRKERQLAKREKLKLAKTASGVPGADDQTTNQTAAAKARKHLSVPLTFLLDCGFDEQMLDKEIISISSQITKCYSDNRKAIYQPSLAISSFGGRLKTRFNTVLKEFHVRWRSTSIEEDDFVAVANKAKERMKEGQFPGFDKCPGLETNANIPPDSGEIVYLTADSDEVLEELQPYSVYIIGGIVDRNRHKGICYKRATDRGIKTAKLPIGKYMQMNSRAVLATNHVYEIMLEWLELKDWGEAFMRVIPKRKGGVLKGRGSNEDEEAEADGSQHSNDRGGDIVGASTQADTETIDQ